MEILVAATLLARVVLAATFVTSGTAKLFDPTGTRKALHDLGAPAALAPPLSRVLPWIELAVALGLFVTATSWLASGVAAGLLAVFTAVIARNLIAGRRPDCRCFGQIGAGPIGRGTVARNVVLLAIATVPVAAGPDVGGPDLVGGAAALLTHEPVGVTLGIALAIGLAIQSRFLGQLLAQNGRLLVRLEQLEERRGLQLDPTPGPPAVGLAIGAQAPSFSLVGLHGETLTLAALTAIGLPVGIVFMDPGCGPCNAMLPDLGRWQREHVGRLTLAVVSRGTPEANRAKAAEHGLRHVLLQKNREVADSYRAPATPSAVVVSPEGLIVTPVSEGAPAIGALIARSAGVDLAANAPHDHGAPATIGQPAPSLRLSDIEGRAFDPAKLRGRQSLVVFWDPACGFCAQLLGEIREWEGRADAAAPRLVVVSAGSAEANRDLGFRAPVLIDRSFALGHAFGATGTPSAVLIDASGNIASAVAAGGPAVMALATQRAGMQS